MTICSLKLSVITDYLNVFLYSYLCAIAKLANAVSLKALQEIHSLPTENSVGNINNSVGN